MTLDATRKLADEGLAGEPTTEAGRRLAEAIASLDERLPIDPGDAILAIEAEAATPPALRCDYDCDACRAQPEDEEYPDTLRETLRMALPRAINFRFLPPRIVSDAIWGEVADELVAALDANVEETP